MCQLCYASSASSSSPWTARRAFLLAAGSAAAAPVLAQVNVGEASRMRSLVPADKLEAAAAQQYSQLLQQAQSQKALAPESSPQLQRIRGIAQRLIPQAGRWNDRAKGWRWEVNLIGSKSVNAFCMPGGKIAIFSGLLAAITPSDDELAMVMGHEMAHALREHARARIAKSQGTGALLSLGAQLFGLGQLGDVAANVGTQLISLKFSRDDEIEADLVGLELAARGGYDPQASLSLWQKMAKAGGGSSGGFLSTHPAGPERMRRLEENIPRVRGLYREAVARR
ncbi:MAG: M48 family metallopeptidase [Pseudomonadota bacterium]